MSNPDDIPASYFRQQWTGATDVFTVLFILGGDVVQLALAAVAGDVIVPLAFSFGWVAYAISALLSAIGENRLVRCPPEVSMLVVNVKNGYTRANQSWLLSRFMKTYTYWMPAEVRDAEQNPRPASDDGFESQRMGRHTALCVSVYHWSATGKPGVPARDWVWWSGLVVTVLQLGIAAVPFGLYDDWSVFLLTAAGTLLVYATGSMPQWRREKWQARRQKKDVALTLGNGTKHVIIVQGADSGLDLEDLAANIAPDMFSTRIYTSALAVFWLLFLFTSTAVQSHTWFLLAVGGLGMLHNLIVAGAPRSPSSLGLPIELSKVSADVGGTPHEDPVIFAETKVMWTLMELEMNYENWGKSLLGEFFPGNLMSWEEQWWNSSDPQERRLLLRQAKEKFFQKRMA
ncbi:hypothetical protein DL767_008268 [Monosporascus sp. MG133]|nr:hypothetical protein DL767_008268 [Monosporascus sp. MG133]